MVRTVHDGRRIRPIRRRNGRFVLTRRRFVENRQKLVGLGGRRLQVDDGVGAVAVEGVEDEVAVKVPRVQPRERQTVAVSGQRRLRRGKRWPRGRGKLFSML